MTLIIPMRSGSKRLKDKNIQTVSDGQVVYYNKYLDETIMCKSYMFYLVYKTAVCSRLFDKIIFAVDKEYEKIVRDAIPEAEIYVRNKKNSRDKSPLIDLVREVSEVYDIKDKYMTIMYSTSILTTEKHLIDAFKTICMEDRDCVFPVVRQQLDFNYRAGDSGSYTTHGAKHADAFFIFNLKRSLDNNAIISTTNDGFIEVSELEYQDVHTAEDIEILKKKYKLR